MQDSASSSPERKSPSWMIADLLLPLLLAVLISIVFRGVLFSGETISKLDLLHHYDYWQNPSASEPLTYTDDPSAALTHIPNERFAGSTNDRSPPLWNQLNGGGRPFFAEFQTLPWSFFHAFFPSKSVFLYNLAILLKLYLAGLGTYFLSRRLNLAPWAAFAAAVAYALCQRNLQWLELVNNFCFYPWLILAFLWLAAKPSLKRAVPAGFVTAACAYNMHPEAFACAAISAAIICLDQFCAGHKSKQAIGRWLLWCGLAAVLAFMVAAPLLLPFIEFILESSSYKFQEQAQSFAFLQWYDFFANLVLPIGSINTYCGPVLGLLLLLGLVLCLKGRKALAVWFLINLLFCVRPLYFETLFLAKPFAFLLPEYPLATCILLQSIIAAAGLDAIVSNGVLQRQKTILIYFPAAIALALIFAQTEFGCSLISRFSDFAYAKPQTNLLFVFVSASLVAAIVIIAIVIKKVTLPVRTMLAATLSLANTGLLLSLASAELKPREKLEYRQSAYLDLVRKNEARMVATGCEIFQPDTNLVYGIDDFRSLAPIHPKRYAAYAEEAGIKPRISFLQECPSLLNPLFNLASVDYVLSDRYVEFKKNSYADLNAVDVPLQITPGKIAEGFRLERADLKYLPDKSCLRAELTYYIRGDIENRYYCRLLLTDSAQKVLAANVWPYLSINEGGTPLQGHLYRVNTSLVVPRGLAAASTIWVGIQIRDLWHDQNLVLKGAAVERQGNTNRLAQFQKKDAEYKGDLTIVGDNEDGFALFENPQARPRAYLVHNALSVATPLEALQKLKDPSATWDQTAVIEGLEPTPSNLPLPAVEPGSTKDSVRIRQRDGDSVQIESVSPAAGYLILTDTFYPGWKAMVDGAEERIYPANYLFRAIKMAAGRHTVSFKYQPRSFAAGMILMQAGIGIGLMLLIFGFLRARGSRTTARS